MKKITLLLAAVAMLAGGAFAEEKACCKKKGEKCHKEAGSCCKDKKDGKKHCDKDAEAKEEKKEAPKSNS